MCWHDSRPVTQYGYRAAGSLHQGCILLRKLLIHLLMEISHTLSTACTSIPVLLVVFLLHTFSL